MLNCSNEAEINDFLKNPPLKLGGLELSGSIKNINMYYPPY